MNTEQMQAAIEAMAREHEEKYNELRKPTSTEVRQSRVQFEISPQWRIPSFTLGCVYCNTGYEDDYYVARVGERMMAFFGRHKDCTPGCLPPEVRKEK